MEPTLLAGDLLTARPLSGPQRRNQLIIYEMESGPYVKRVVGLPGDTLSMRDGLLSVNGTLVEEPYPVPPDVVSSAFAWQRRHLVASVDTAA
jgi:signal peptidase I